jgi:hypothetical protein
MGTGREIKTRASWPRAILRSLRLLHLTTTISSSTITGRHHISYHHRWRPSRGLACGHALSVQS